MMDTIGGPRSRIRFQGQERARIQAHLRRVERELRAKSTANLEPELRAARARNLVRLREYRARGDFPRNLEVDVRVPFLRDPFGTPCAVAYLVAESEGTAFLDALAARANRVYVDDVTDGPLLDWIDASGLTQEECARIQPSYDPFPPPSLPPIDPPISPPPNVSAFPALVGHEAELIALFALQTGLWLAWVLRVTGALDFRRMRRIRTARLPARTEAVDPSS